MTRCPRCGESAPDGARFCPSCGQALAETVPSPDRERRRISAVFVDLVGSTAAADQVDPEDVGDVLGRYYTAVERALAGNGGTLEKFIGDAVVALYGVPVAHEDDEARAVTAALAVRDAVRALADDEPPLELHVRVGVASGEALVAIESRAERGDNLAAGDVMNLAARLQAAAPTDGVVVDEETASAVRARFALEALADITVKGKSEPLAIYGVTGPANAAARGAPPTRLHGREVELTELEWLLAAAFAAAHGALIAVLGEPGIGKSRLLAEAERRSPARWIHGTCLAYGEGITYWPLVRAFDEASGGMGGVGAVGRIAARAVPGEQASVAGALATVVGVGTDGRAPPPITRGELHWGVRRALELIAADGPLVLVVEDAHWADASLVELLQSAALAEAPVAVVLTARPGEGPELPGAGRIELEPLAPAASAALAAELAGGEAAAELVARAAGNPLFLHELARTARSGGAGQVPRTLGAVIGARLDRLPRPVRTLAGVASVVGIEFWAGALAALEAEGADPDELVTAELAERSERSTLHGERQYAFLHGLLRDVAYSRLPKARRSELHLRCARWLADRPGEHDELVELVAAHLEQACLVASSLARRPFTLPLTETVDALMRSAERAERREGFGEAAGFVARALVVKSLEGGEPSRPLRIRLARLQIALGELEAARSLLDGVVGAAAADGAAHDEAAARVIRANAAHKLGLREEARADVEAACTLAALLDDAELIARAGFERAAVLDVYDGDVRGAIDVLGDSLVAADRVDVPALSVEARLRLGFLLFEAGDLAGSEAVLRRVIETAEDAGYRREAARAQFELAVVRSLVADDEREFETLAAAAHGVALRVDDAYFVPQIGRFRAQLALERGDVEESERLARDAFAAAGRIGSWSIVDAGAMLVAALLAAGAPEEARSVLEAMREALPAGDDSALASVDGAEAAVAAHAGDTAAAWAATERALEAVDRRGSPLLGASARWDAAQLLPPSDPRVAALLDEAGATWRERGAVRMTRRAEAMRAATAAAHP